MSPTRFFRTNRLVGKLPSQLLRALSRRMPRNVWPAMPITLFYDRRQRGQNAVSEPLDRFKSALADRYTIQEELTPKPRRWPSRPDDCILCAIKTLGAVLLADTLEPYTVAPVNRSGTLSGSSVSAGWWPAPPSLLLRPGTLLRRCRAGVRRHPTFRFSVGPTAHCDEGNIQ